MELSNSGANDVQVTDQNTIELGSVSTGTGVLTITADNGATGGGITQNAAGMSVGGDAIFNAGAGVITLTDAGNDFAGTVDLLNSGADNVAITDGNDIVLGTISVGTGTLQVNAVGITQNGADTITQAAGAGVATFNGGAGVITLSNGNEFTGPVELNNSGANAVAVNDVSTLTISQTSVGDALDIDAAGALVLGSAGSVVAGNTVTADTSAGDCTVSNQIDSGGGSVAINPAGTIYLNFAGTVVTSSDGNITFDSNVVLNQDTTINSVGTGGGTITFTGTVLSDATDRNLSLSAGTGTIEQQNSFGSATNPLSTFTLTSGTLDMNGNNMTASGNFSITGGTVNVDVGNAAGANTITLSGAATGWTNNGSFVAQNGTVIFNSDGTQSVDANGTNGRFYNLTVDSSATGTTLDIITTDIYVDGTLTTSTGNDTVDMNGLNFTIDTLQNNGVLELNGTQGTQTITTRDTDSGEVRYYGASAGDILIPEFNDLRISGSATFSVSPATISVYGSIYLDAGILNGNNSTLRVQGSFDSSGGGQFTPSTSTVQFFGWDVTSYVRGDNSFYNFVVDETDESSLVDTGGSEEGKVIRIQNNTVQIIAAGGEFRIRGTNTNPPPTAPAGAPENEVDWSTRSYSTSYISIVSTSDSVSADTDRWELRLPATATLDTQYADIWFSYANPSLNVPADTYIHDCDEWLRFIYITDSFTKDIDRNGKIDRIEVVVPVNLDDNYNNFDIEVNGYVVTNIDSGTGVRDRIFWIYLEEKPYLDTDARPSWYIVDSGDLRDDATNSYQVVHEPPKGPGNPEVPWDDADPVVGYTLAVANGQAEVFVQFSEKVYDTSGASITNTNLSPYSGTLTVDSVSEITGDGTGFEEILVTMSGAIPVADIVGQDTFAFNGIDDQAPDPSTLDPVSPAWTGQPEGPNELQARSVYGAAAPPADQPHRVSDIGLGVIQPVYALNTETQRSIEREPDIGRITDFDATDFLQPQALYIESNVAGTGGDARIHFNTRVSSTFISSDNSGLWLPIFDESDFSGIVPFPLTTGVDNLPDTDVAANIAAHTVASSNSELIDNTSFDFFFEYPDGGSPPLYHGRCSDPSASDWYRRIRPWSFDLQQVRAQTSQVSILKNVIDPRKGEKVDLFYILEKGGRVTIQVFNLGGDLVDVLKRGRQAPGEYAISWDGRNQAGNIVARGIYYVRVTAPDIDEYRKVLIVK